MIGKLALQIYSAVFLNITFFKGIPYDWDHKRLIVTPSNSLLGKWLWKFNFALQIFHFTFLTIRVFESIHQKLSVSFLLFQLVWNVMYLIPIFAQINTVMRYHEIPNCINKWLEIEMRMTTKLGKMVTRFVVIFLPVGCLHTLLSGLAYVYHPEMPMFLYSYFSKYLNPYFGNAIIRIIFGIVELSLVGMDWGLIFFYMFLLMGTCRSGRSWIDQSNLMENSQDAHLLYERAMRFSMDFNEALILVIPAMKIIMFQSSVVCIYNSLRFDLPILFTSITAVTFLADVLVFLFVFPPLCFLNNASIKCIHTWKWKQDYQQTKLSKKTWETVQPISITIRPFYKLTSKTVLTYFSLIFTYVITTIAVFPAK